MYKHLNLKSTIYLHFKLKIHQVYIKIVEIKYVDKCKLSTKHVKKELK